MIERALRAMGDPDALFGWLAGQAENNRRAYLVVLVGSLVSAAVFILAIHTSDMPELEPMRELLEDARMGALGTAVTVALVAPISALLTWALAWIPVRLGAGGGKRLWEVAGWSQVPVVALSMLQLALMVSLPVGPTLSSGLSAIAAGWSAWFVYAGVGALSEGGHPLRAAVLYFLYWIMIPVFNLLAQSALPQPASSPGILG